MSHGCLRMKTIWKLELKKRVQVFYWAGITNPNDSEPKRSRTWITNAEWKTTKDFLKIIFVWWFSFRRLIQLVAPRVTQRCFLVFKKTSKTFVERYAGGRITNEDGVKRSYWFLGKIGRDNIRKGLITIKLGEYLKITMLSKHYFFRLRVSMYVRSGLTLWSHVTFWSLWCNAKRILIKGFYIKNSSDTIFPPLTL